MILSNGTIFWTTNCFPRHDDKRYQSSKLLKAEWWEELQCNTRSRLHAYYSKQFPFRFHTKCHLPHNQSCNILDSHLNQKDLPNFLGFFTIYYHSKILPLETDTSCIRNSIQISAMKRQAMGAAKALVLPLLLVAFVMLLLVESGQMVILLPFDCSIHFWYLSPLRALSFTRYRLSGYHNSGW